MVGPVAEAIGLFLRGWFLESTSKGLMSPVTRPLRERLWAMGRGQSPERCDFAAEEMSHLEKLLVEMLMYEPCDRLTAEEALRSEYMLRWGRPAIDTI